MNSSSSIITFHFTDAKAAPDIDIDIDIIHRVNIIPEPTEPTHKIPR